MEPSVSHANEHHHQQLGVVLLAAGSASRMGSRPKCLLEREGIPLIRLQLIALSGADELVVVLGHYADQIAPTVQHFPIALVRNPEPDAGQDSSLRLGLQALSPRVDAVLIALADQPLIDSKDIGDLIKAYDERPKGTLVVRPFVDSLPGNPVMFSRSVLEQILAGDANTGARQWQAAHPEAVHRWHTANQHYRIDVDSPADVDALASNTGRRLYWPGQLIKFR